MGDPMKKVATRAQRRWAVLLLLASITSPYQTQAKAQVLRVAVVDELPPCTDVSGKSFRGSSVEIWLQTAARSNQSFRFEAVNNSKEGIQKAGRGDVDLVVGCLNITPNRMQQVEFTMPISDDSLALLTPKNDSSFIEILKELAANRAIRETIIVLILGSLPFATALWFLSKGFQHHDISGATKRQTFFKGWMMLAMGTGIYKMGTAPPSMSIIALTNFIRLIITSIFVASTTSIVINQAEPDDIENTDTLKTALNHKIGVLAGSFSEEWLDRRADSVISASEQLQAIVPISKSSDMIKMLTNGKVGSLFGDTKTMLELRSQLPNPEDYELSGETRYRTPQAFVIGSTLNKQSRRSINQAISELSFEGEIEAILSRWQKSQ